MNSSRKIDKRANPVSRGKYRGGQVPIVIVNNGDSLAAYEFFKTCESRPVMDGAQMLLFALWKEGVEGYLREDPEDVEWVEDGNLGESDICTFNWIANNLLNCDPDKIRAKLLELKQKKTRTLYMQIGFRQWTPEGKKAGFRRE